MNGGDAFSSDAIISGCNNLIQSGEETPTKLCRGLLQSRHRVCEKAQIRPSDFRLRQGNDLKPKNAKALYQRGYVYDIKGERDRAMADYNQAMRLLRR